MTFKQKLDTEKISRHLRFLTVDNKLPEGTYTNLAIKYGTSRQRIYQIARRNNISGPRKAIPEAKCSNCGKFLNANNGFKNLNRSGKIKTGKCYACFRLLKD